MDEGSSIASWPWARDRRGRGSNSSCRARLYRRITGAELARAVASADVLFNPSVTEAFGNVTLEAMACGLPVIAAEATGSTNLVRDGKTGKLVDGANSGGFARALEAYARKPALRRAHGDAGLKVAEKMDWDTINSAVVRAYEKAIVKRKRLDRLKDA